MNEAVEAAQRIASERGDCFIPDQFSNPANPEIHRRTTAEEIWRDTGGDIDVLVAGVGTGGAGTRGGAGVKQREPPRPGVAAAPKAAPGLSRRLPPPPNNPDSSAGVVPAALTLPR